MPLMNLVAGVTIADDATPHNNPRRRLPDWSRSMTGIPVDLDGGKRYVLDPLAEAALFSGTRTLGANGATNYALANVPSLSVSRYRLTWASAGAAPAFRTARALALSGGNAVLTHQANSTVTLASSLGSVFGAVQVGDVVFVPGAATGDTGPFSPSNQGYWEVLTVAAALLTLRRPAGTVFTGATETVAVATDPEVQAFSAAGVQVGDTVEITAGFATSARSAYEVLAVTASRLDFVSSSPLGAETAVPGASGLTVYSAAKRFVWVEADQEVALKYNGATDEGCRVTPLVPGDKERVGVDIKIGVAYSLSVKNRSTARATVLLFTAE